LPRWARRRWAGNLAIPLVKQLTAQVKARDPEAARYVHWGATSQDAIDTGLVLQLRGALDAAETCLSSCWRPWLSRRIVIAIP
jgi:adenylosuccinate lyase